MGIWRASPVEEDPIVVLILWSIWRTERGEDHLVGIRPSSITGRVSSAIASICSHSRTVLTRSGRQYRLLGPRGRHEDATYVWNSWCVVNRVLETTDVTADLIPDCDATDKIALPADRNDDT